MARLSLHVSRAVVAFLVNSIAASALGQITALHIASQSTPANVLPGLVANDIFIDFDGQYTGSSAVVELTTGSIYQDESPFAGDSPPIAALLGLYPTLEWDTIVANGGPTAEDTVGNFGPGGAAIHIDFPGGGGPTRPAVFSGTLIDQSWNPAGETTIVDQQGFMVARITLSDDAIGTFHYYGAASGTSGVGQPGRVAMFPIRNGFIIPEPSAGVLICLAAAAAFIAYRLDGRLARTTSTTSPLRSEQPIHSWGFYHQVGARRPQSHEPHSFIARSSARSASTVSRCDRGGRGPGYGRHGDSAGP